MSEPLLAVRLSEPQLRFDYENRRAVSRDPYQGLMNFGPFDAGERRRKGKKVIRAVVVGRADRNVEMDLAVEALKARRLGRLHEQFEISFVDQIVLPPSTVNQEAEVYRKGIAAWLMEQGADASVDLAFVLHGDEAMYRRASPYYASKAAFLRQGIPTQSICYDNLSGRNIDRFRKYFVTNILTACYAKTGGTPWVVNAESSGRPEITIGVATTAVVGEQSVERYIGISTIFRENGAFALWDITPPEQQLESYEEKLEESVVRAIMEFERRENRTVSRIACHVSGKRAGKRESAAILRGLSRFSGRSIQADIVHITADAPLWLFDGRDESHLPVSGILTYLDGEGMVALMHTEGRGTGARFLTRPLKLSILGSVPEQGCVDIHQHLYDLRWMSWRGVRTSSGPVTIEYPKKMARLLAYLHMQEEVEALQILPRLKDKAWFL